MGRTLSCLALSLSAVLGAGTCRADSIVSDGTCDYSPAFINVGAAGGTVTVYEFGDPPICATGHLGGWVNNYAGGINLWQATVAPYRMFSEWPVVVDPNTTGQPREGFYGAVRIWQDCGPCVKRRFVFRSPKLMVMGVRD